ncbi:hypothetical protein AVEN_17455-1, partial [Araneus ventricosus]
FHSNSVYNSRTIDYEEKTAQKQERKKKTNPMLDLSGDKNPTTIRSEVRALLSANPVRSSTTLQAAKTRQKKVLIVLNALVGD